MTCHIVTTPDGSRAIVCTSGRARRCRWCGAAAPLLCDWKTPRPRNRKKTCDAPICEACTTKPAPDKDLCPSHAGEWETWKARRAAPAL